MTNKNLKIAVFLFAGIFLLSIVARAALIHQRPSNQPLSKNSTVPSVNELAQSIVQTRKENQFETVTVGNWTFISLPKQDLGRDDARHGNGNLIIAVAQQGKRSIPTYLDFDPKRQGWVLKALRLESP